ncbi:MAG: hypothetical protein QF805_05780 [Pirellulaceae bacterium]|nr:hypothetical protein [Pirellulaceae bacterium]
MAFPRLELPRLSLERVALERVEFDPPRLEPLRAAFPRLDAPRVPLERVALESPRLDAPLPLERVALASSPLELPRLRADELASPREPLPEPRVAPLPDPRPLEPLAVGPSGARLLSVAPRPLEERLPLAPPLDPRLPRAAGCSELPADRRLRSPLDISSLVTAPSPLASKEERRCQIDSGTSFLVTLPSANADEMPERSPPPRPELDRSRCAFATPTKDTAAMPVTTPTNHFA